LVAEPGLQTPRAQTSPSVQALPSEQGAVLFVWTQPVPGSQESSVQTLLSLQLVAEPGLQTPRAQTSPSVQALPSEQGAVLFVWTQPAPGSHESSVQTLLSSQPVAEPGLQTPRAQTSPSVQALPSEQGAVLFVWTQPVPGSQESSVQTLLSSQLVAEPGLQTPS